jgi:hypothetical protein
MIALGSKFVCCHSSHRSVFVQGAVPRVSGLGVPSIFRKAKNGELRMNDVMSVRTGQVGGFVLNVKIVANRVELYSWGPWMV